MAIENTYNDDERLYFQMLQSNIERMANNSANSKTWLVTIITGFLAVGCGIEALNGWILLACLPVCLFWYLDAYYLSLERGLRNRENDFIKKRVLADYDKYKVLLFNFCPMKMEKEDEEKGYVKTTGTWRTTSVLPFYVTIIVVIIIITLILNWSSCMKWFTSCNCF